MSRRNRLPSIPFPVAIVLLALCSGAPTAIAGDPNAALAACTALSERSPDDALASAETWEKGGGGDPAKLCRAMALFHKGAFKDAATAFAELVPKLGKADDKSAAALLARAGWANLRAGDATAADRLYSEALARRPDDVDLYIDRAFARAEAGRYDDAAADLDQAIKRDPQRPESYLYRAAAHKSRKDYAKATEDVEQALKLRPNDVEALLLRGNIRALSGNFEGAAEDWRLVVGLSPDSNQGRSAKTNLDRLAAAGKKGDPQ